MPSRNYLPHDPAAGHPAGAQLRYECRLCGCTVASMPAHVEACACGNVFVDRDAGRVAIAVPDETAVYEGDD
jgi:hypothetical protein